MGTRPEPVIFKKAQFGPFEYEQASGELRKHGIRIRLQGQPLQILAALIEEPDRVISRDEFQQQLWKGSTFVDFEHGLNAAINRLRRTLGTLPTNLATLRRCPDGATVSSRAWSSP